MQTANNDFDITSQNISTEVASVNTREIQQIVSPNTDLFMTVDIPEPYRIDAKPFIERPFYVNEVVFRDTDPRYSLLTTSVKFLPGDIARSNLSLLNMFKMGAYGRPDLVLNVSMAGTITHAGCILVGVLPPMPAYPIGTKTLINTILSGPHAKLFANEATSVALPVPWFCNTDMATLDMENTPGYQSTLDITGTNGNYATLVFLVLNPLQPSTGSSKQISIIIEACFKHFDIVVPTPRFTTWQSQSGLISTLTSPIKGILDVGKGIAKNVTSDAIDMGASWLMSLTGLHNPNDPVIHERVIVAKTNFQNMVDMPQVFEKLDPFSCYNRLVKEPLFGTNVDEMQVSHITAKDQLIGTFKVNIDNSVGNMVWSRPISPFQGGILVDRNQGIVSANNLELLHAMSRAWRGGLNIKIESVMNNKQQVKLKMLKYYNPSINVLTAYPGYSSIANAPSHLMEFTQGGQVHCINLPYLCRNDLTPCADNTNFEGLFHAMYYIYVAQPLANSDGSPTTIEFNVYMNGDENLQFYGYTTANTYHYPFGLYASTFKAESGKTVEVMNKPQKQDQDMSRQVTQYNHDTRLQPLVDVRPWIRRMYKGRSQSTILRAAELTTVTIPLSSILGEEPSTWMYTPIELISRMFYGKTVGFKFRMNVYLKPSEQQLISGDISTLQTRVFYLPQTLSYLEGNFTVSKALPNVAAFPSPGPTTNLGEIPLTFQSNPITDNTTTYSYEFVIPDTSFYKFMGSPDKFRDFAGSATASQLSTSDFGSLVIQFLNESKIDQYFETELYVGLTDESRLGFHSIAPPFVSFKVDSYYLGDGQSSTAVVPNTLNPFIYRGGFQ